MAYEYKFMLDEDSLKFVKLHGSTIIRAMGLMKRKEGAGEWVSLARIELQIEPHGAERMKANILQALQEFFTNHYANLQATHDWLDNTSWTAEELTVPELEV